MRGGAPSGLTTCTEGKLADGWYPLSGWISDFTKQGYGNRWGEVRIHRYMTLELRLWPNHMRPSGAGLSKG